MFDVHSDFDEDVGGLFLKSEQVITNDFLDRCRLDRDNSLLPMTNDLQRVASVPVAVVEKWLREGFDIYKESGKAILARLRNEHLDAFITTKRSL